MSMSAAVAAQKKLYASAGGTTKNGHTSGLNASPQFKRGSPMKLRRFSP